MGLRFTAKVDLGGLRNLVDNEVRLFANETYLKLISDFVPRETGALMESVDVQPDGIHYLQPYATRQYFGEDFNFSKEKNEKACAKWDEVAMLTRKEKLIRSIREFIKERKT